MVRILVVTAAEMERDAVVGGRSAAPVAGRPTETLRCVEPAFVLDVLAAGIGPAASAVATCAALAAGYDLVLSSGIAGGFEGVRVGSVIVADAVVHADLGAETAEGFSSMAELGWGPVRFEVDAELATALATLTEGRIGEILTVSTVTGNSRRAAELAAAYPGAVGEAMEGIGVFLAARQMGVPFAELRTISNRVGPRDRAEWRMGEALASLTAAFDRMLAAPRFLEHLQPSEVLP